METFTENSKTKVSSKTIGGIARAGDIVTFGLQKATDIYTKSYKNVFGGSFFLE